MEPVCSAAFGSRVNNSSSPLKIRSRGTTRRCSRGAWLVARNHLAPPARIAPNLCRYARALSDGANIIASRTGICRRDFAFQKGPFVQHRSLFSASSLEVRGRVPSQKDAKERFHVGNLYLNRKCTEAMVGAHPFGGFNMSGTDSKAGGPDYLLLFMQGKSVATRL